MKKAANHRKRHLPPGPCGIWFQSQQQLNKQGGGISSTNATTSGSSSRKRSQHDAALENTTTVWDPSSSPPSQSSSSSPQQGGNSSSSASSSSSSFAADMSFSPAWSCMLQELNLITPYLPPTMRLPAERYRQLRPHVPPNYVMLLEIQRGEYDRFSSAAVVSQNNNSVLVLVSTVESHIHNNIWTVELKDETGATIKAWVEPNLVQQQLQQSHDASGIIRPGVVWRLCPFGMIVLEREDDEEERVERMLLIRGSAIGQVWTPEQQQQNAQQEETDTPRRQRQFLDWMERRKALPLIGDETTEEHNMLSGSAAMDEEDDGPPDEEEEEVYHSNANPRNIRYGDDFDCEEDDQEAGSSSTAVAPRLPRPQIPTENVEDSEDEDQFERGHSVGGLWNSATTTTGFSLPRQNPGISSSIRASQSQDFSPNWSRPRLEDAEEAATNVNDTERNAGQNPTPLTTPAASTVHSQNDTAPETSSEANTTGQQDKEDTQSSQAQELVAEEITGVNEKEGEVAEKRSEPRPGRSKSQASPMATAWEVPTQNSSFWNSMLDDDDDDDDGDESDNGIGAANPLQAVVQKVMPSEPTENVLPEEPRREPEGSDNDADSDAEDLGTKTSEPASMFDAGNFGNMDLAAFSDDDDDDD